MPAINLHETGLDCFVSVNYTRNGNYISINSLTGHTPSGSTHTGFNPGVSCLSIDVAGQRAAYYAGLACSSTQTGVGGKTTPYMRFAVGGHIWRIGNYNTGTVINPGQVSYAVGTGNVTISVGFHLVDIAQNHWNAWQRGVGKSSIYRGTIPTEIPPEPPLHSTTISINSMDYFGVTLNWSTGNTAVSSFQYQFSTNGTTWSNWRNSSSSSSIHTTSGWATFGGLNHSTSYYFKMISQESASTWGSRWSLDSNIVSGITPVYRTEFDVVYHGNGAGIEGGDGAPMGAQLNIFPSQIKKRDQVLKLHPYIPDRTSFTFNGWNTQVDGKGITYQASANIPANVNQDLILYAQWKSATYTVIFMDRGVELKKQLVSYGADASPPPIPSRGAAIPFMGWSGSYITVTSNRTITAIWDVYPIWIKRDGPERWEPYEIREAGDSSTQVSQGSWGLIYRVSDGIAIDPQTATWFLKSWWDSDGGGLRRTFQNPLNVAVKVTSISFHLASMNSGGQQFTSSAVVGTAGPVGGIAYNFYVECRSSSGQVRNSSHYVPGVSTNCSYNGRAGAVHTGQRPPQTAFGLPSIWGANDSRSRKPYVFNFPDAPEIPPKGTCRFTLTVGWIGSGNTGVTLHWNDAATSTTSIEVINTDYIWRFDGSEWKRNRIAYQLTNGVWRKLEP